MARYLITGIAGFIGSTLARALVTQGHHVSGIDNLSTGSMENLAEIQSSIFFKKADIRDVDAIRPMFEGVDFVSHQAAMASVPRSVQDPITSHESNINGTLNVLLAARDAGVRRLVYAASSSAYGDQPTQPKHEQMIPQPLSPYAVQKLTGEHYIQAFCRVYGMEAVCLRYFNIFGPRQAADSPYSGVIAQFVYKMLAGVTPTIHGDGMNSRDFTFVENAVQANLLACGVASEFADGRVYNVGTGESHTILELYSALAELLGFKAEAKFGTARAGDVQHSLASIDRARTELGYVPTTGFFQGLKQTVDWYIENAPTPELALNAK